MKKIAAVCLVMVLAFSLTASAVDDLKYEIGKKVTNLILKDQDGAVFDLEKELAGENVKGVVFLFLSYKCPTSIACDDRYVQYAADFREKGILLVGINSNVTENVQDMKANAKKKKYNFPVFKDPGNVIADRFSAKKTPEVFFVDSKSVLRYRGRIDDSHNYPTRVKETTLANIIGEYLAGKELSVTVTQSVG